MLIVTLALDKGLSFMLCNSGQQKYSAFLFSTKASRNGCAVTPCHHTLAKCALSLWRRLQTISLHSESLFSTPMRHSSLVLHSPWREHGGMQRCHLKLLNKSPARSWHQGGNILHVSEFSYLATSIHNWIELWAICVISSPNTAHYEAVNSAPDL